MTCRETRPLLPLFLDGELDARQLRGVALHSTRCTACEQELQQLERLQDAVIEHINARVEEVDLNRIWAGIAPRLDTMSVPWWSRVRSRWETMDVRWRWPAPALATLAAAALLTLALWPTMQGGDAKPAAEVAATDNSASLDLVESHVGSTALLTEPETNTMVLWISDDDPMAAVPAVGLEELP